MHDGYFHSGAPAIRTGWRAARPVKETAGKLTDISPLHRAVGDAALSEPHWAGELIGDEKLHVGASALGEGQPHGLAHFSKDAQFGYAPEPIGLPEDSTIGQRGDHAA